MLLDLQQSLNETLKDHQQRILWIHESKRGLPDILEEQDCLLILGTVHGVSRIRQITCSGSIHTTPQITSDDFL